LDLTAHTRGGFRGGAPGARPPPPPTHTPLIIEVSVTNQESERPSVLVVGHTSIFQVGVKYKPSYMTGHVQHCYLHVIILSILHDIFNLCDTNVLILSGSIYFKYTP
jgi:hypothetical protein